MTIAQAVAAMVLVGTGVAWAQPAATPRSPARPASVPPAVPATPQQTTATFGDWTLRCVRPAGAAKACEVVQVVQQDGKPVAQMAIGVVAKGQRAQFTVLVPPSVSFAAVPALVAPGEDGAGMALGWRRCLPGGCVGDAELSDEAVARMRGWAQAARVVYQDAAGRGVALPLSPTGLGAALDALAKEDLS